MTRLMTIPEAKRQGFIIDDCAPGRPLAYKGPRFNHTEHYWLETETETELHEKLAALEPDAKAWRRSLETANHGEIRVRVGGYNARVAFTEQQLYHDDVQGPRSRLRRLANECADLLMLTGSAAFRPETVTANLHKNEL